MTSTALARQVVQALLDAGVRHAVLCPGSRNAPLSFALEAAARAELLALHTRIDERTAGFLALGIAKSSRRPVAVVTTSGTAVANLHPAVLEAAHAGVPLVVVSADRPASVRGTGASQTTDQVAIFGDAAPTVDIVDEIPALDELPAHWNVQFAEPLVPEDDWTPADSSAHQKRPLGPPEVTSRLAPGPRTVVVAGDDCGNTARLLAEAGGWPLLAEPTSGSRNGSTPIRTYRLLLGTPLGERIERVVVLGHPTLSRPVARLLAREDVEVVSVRAKGRWAARPFPVAAEHESVAVDGPDDPAWLREWQDADARLSRDIDTFVTQREGLTPHEVAAAVHAAVPPNGLLLVGASNPIRDLDLMAGAYRVGDRRLVIANRGLAGIDGTLSTAIGAVLGRPHTSRALAYVGDVTFLHDLTALVIGPAERRPDLTIVVANDDGGSIFATLEQGAAQFSDSYDQLFGTPHGADLGAICTGLRVPHWRVRDRAELDLALANPNGGIEVVEAVIRRDDRRELDLALKDLA